MRLIEDFIKYKGESKGLKKDTLELYCGDLKDFQNFIKIDLLDVTTKDILKYIEHLKKNYQPNSIIRKVSTLKIFYKYLLEKRLINEYPIENIVIEKSPDKELDTLEFWEVNSILDICGKDPKGQRDKLIIKLLVETNLTINDVLKIKLSDLKLFSYIYVFNDESGEKIKLSSELSEELKEYVEKIREKITDDNSNLVFYGFSRQSFRARFMSLGRKSNIKREITPNMLRNTLKIMVKSNEELNEENIMSSIKEKYFQIGIGDD